jgi:hypothetical protein
MIFCLYFPLAWAQVTEQQSRSSARVIGKWLTKSSGHYDFQSATTVNPKRAGKKFFGIPDMQMASDYGVSYMMAPRTREVTNAYETIGADTSSMANSLHLPRFHLNLGFANKHDFNLSYLIPAQDAIRGWGLGYKQVLTRINYLYVSYRLAYGRSHKEDYFSASSLVNDLSISLYLRLIDFYMGARHWVGRVNFKSTIPELQLPPMEYFSTAGEIEPYFGVILATTTHTRFTLEASSFNKTYSFAGKFSFHFDSLFPSFENWFRDPRYIKQ